MLRRATCKSASLVALPLATSARNYNMFVFKNPDRRPQLTAEERSKVKVNYAEWPEEFRDYDPEDPYKNSPPIIENLTSWNLFLWGVEVAFIYQFYELVFYKSI
ncbi:hypothetical protein AGDE_00518 [Angomonas deanei]|uniref:Uncharacterized protein n=1 Tax=Angomonas deanei TaxID=59799 RepID=S9WF33_9TRYP|nr:hypothetical protein AGDE_06148 [Angomonas deanei]EPY38676.1 hypothetical protein AGDE_05253 [Angomonas deanei]EPY43403.1 hypothetical protein AGDE_00518 [Angomonas deanei]CAD2214788.1 hypothetical protein, conserved [Angomonas deanei]|eukprot:EPY37786.1 hypothetical protein AGDE_06148 [Angomonas deanei]